MPYWISAIFVFDLQLICRVLFVFYKFDLLIWFSTVSEERTGEMLESANTHGCFSETPRFRIQVCWQSVRGTSAF